MVEKCDACRKAHGKCIRVPPLDGDENTKQHRCEHCIKINGECGPALNHRQSLVTTVGRKRRRIQRVQRQNSQSTPQFENNTHQSSSASDGSATPPNTPSGPSLYLPDVGESTSATTRGKSTVQHVQAELNSELEDCWFAVEWYRYMDLTAVSSSQLEESHQGQNESGGSRLRRLSRPVISKAIFERLRYICYKVGKHNDTARPLEAMLQVNDIVEVFQGLIGVSKSSVSIEIDTIKIRMNLIQRRSLFDQDSSYSAFGTQSDNLQFRALEAKMNNLTKSLNRLPELPAPEVSPPSKETRCSKMVDNFFSKGPQKQEGVKEADKCFPILFMELLTLPGKAQSLVESAHKPESLTDCFGKNLAHVMALGDLTDSRILSSMIRKHREELDKKDDDNLTPLMIAVIHGHLNSCRLLIKAGYKQNFLDASSRNLVSLAARHGHKEVVELLINEYKHTAIEKSGWCSPVDDAIFAGNQDIVNFLVKKRVDEGKAAEALATEKGILIGISQPLQELSIPPSRPSIPSANDLDWQPSDAIVGAELTTLDAPSSTSYNPGAAVGYAYPHHTNAPHLPTDLVSPLQPSTSRNPLYVNTNSYSQPYSQYFPPIGQPFSPTTGITSQYHSPTQNRPPISYFESQTVAMNPSQSRPQPPGPDFHSQLANTNTYYPEYPPG